MARAFLIGPLLAVSCAAGARAPNVMDAGPDAGVDARPESATVDVRLVAPGWTAEAMEKEGLVPVETAAARASAVSAMESEAVQGAGRVRVTFAPGLASEAARRALHVLPRDLPRDITLEMPYSRRMVAFAFALRFPGSGDPDDPDALRRIVVGSTPISGLASLVLKTRPSAILRFNRERVVMVWVRPGDGADRAELGGALRRAVAPLSLPPGVRVVRVDEP